MAAGDIWDFVEENLKTEVPAYFKTVLRACGYSNGISISAIEEDDLEYIQKEVRTGNVGKVFDGSAVDYLEGCTKNEKEFEFVLGHKKFLKAIVGFLKKHLAENGLGSFTLNPKKKTQPSASKPNKMIGSKKIMQRSRRNLDPRILPLVKFVMKTDLEVQGKAPTFSSEILAKHREDLLTRTITAIIKFAPKMFEERIDEIKGKLSGKFITFELDNKEQLIAVIQCVFCEKTVTAYPKPSTQNPYLWKAPNFNRHLRIIHRFENDGSQESDTDNDSESSSHHERKQTLNDLDEDQVLEMVSEQKQKLQSSVGAKVLKTTGNRKKILRVSAEKDERKETSNGELCGPSYQDEENKTNNEFVKEKISADYGNGKNMIDLDEAGASKETLSAEERHLHSNSENMNILSKGEESVSGQKLGEMPLVLKNGAKTRSGNNFIVTKRTCAFDTIINAFASIYSENSNVRNQLNNNRSNLTEFIKSLFKRTDTTLHLPNDYYAEMLTFRNTILMELYEGWCKSGNFIKNQETTFIDCKTGIGALFGRICKLDKSFVTGTESKNCQKCGHAFTKLLPFLKTNGKIRNLGKIGDYLEINSQERLCALCKSKCEITTSFSNVVVLETEPTSVHQNEKVTLDKITKQLNIGGTPYMLRAVMHFDVKLEHFVAYTRQHNDSWNLLDDLKKSGQKVEAATEVHPFILCYASMIHSENSIHDKKSVQSAVTNPSQQKHESQDALLSVPEPAARPALVVSQNDEEIKKKRKKNHKQEIKKKRKKKHEQEPEKFI